MSDNRAIDVLWDDNPVDITAEANFIWSIANKLRGSYMPDKYGDVIIPMTREGGVCSIITNTGDITFSYSPDQRD